MVLEKQKPGTRAHAQSVKRAHTIAPARTEYLCAFVRTVPCVTVPRTRLQRSLHQTTRTRRSPNVTAIRECMCGVCPERGLTVHYMSPSLPLIYAGFENVFWRCMHASGCIQPVKRNLRNELSSLAQVRAEWYENTIYEVKYWTKPPRKPDVGTHDPAAASACLRNMLSRRSLGKPGARPSVTETTRTDTLARSCLRGGACGARTVTVRFTRDVKVWLPVRLVGTAELRALRKC